MAKIYNITGPVRQFSGAILCFVGPPWKSVEWRLLEGHGTLTPFTTFTDAVGRCSCRFDASGIVERVLVAVAYVPDDQPITEPPPIVNPFPVEG